MIKIYFMFKLPMLSKHTAIFKLNIYHEHNMQQQLTTNLYWDLKIFKKKAWKNNSSILTKHFSFVLFLSQTFYVHINVKTNNLCQKEEAEKGNISKNYRAWFEEKWKSRKNRINDNWIEHNTDNTAA